MIKLTPRTISVSSGYRLPQRETIAGRNRNTIVSRPDETEIVLGVDKTIKPKFIRDNKQKVP